MNILSLFDGISAGRIALDRAGIKYRAYYRAEINKYANKIATTNYPDSIDLGDVNNIKFDKPVDLLMGGSPCQSFSNSGKREGFDSKNGGLFYEYIRILKETRPRHFLFENVKLKATWRDIISKEFGVEPILINSSLVSGQNRERYYWTNIEGIQQPADKKIYLKDILESGEVDREKSYTIDANYHKGGNLNRYFNKNSRQLVFDKPIKIGYIGKDAQGKRIYDINGKTGLFNIKDSQSCRIYSTEGKSITLTSKKNGGPELGTYFDGISFRKLSILECERLQTLPEGYVGNIKISNTQKYKAIGNSWTVDVIVQILRNMKNLT